MSEKRGLAQLSRALRLGRRGRESETRTPDHSCLVAQSRVTVSIPKQARDNKRNLVYTIWTSSAVGPQRSNEVPDCILVIMRVANIRIFLYNHASQFLRPTGILPEFPL